MNNCLKHADASEVKIDLMANKRFLKLTFSDNGKGFDTNILKASKQFGIVGMRERIQGLGGKFELQSDQNGTIITGLIQVKKR
jgi:signal transduction histidine kinase